VKLSLTDFEAWRAGGGSPDDESIGLLVAVVRTELELAAALAHQELALAEHHRSMMIGRMVIHSVSEAQRTVEACKAAHAEALAKVTL
jgi:hypothetical protein